MVEAAEDGKDAAEPAEEVIRLTEEARGKLLPAAIAGTPAFQAALMASLLLDEGGVAEGYEEATEGEASAYAIGYFALQRVKALWQGLAGQASPRQSADVEAMLAMLDGLFPSQEMPERLSPDPEQAEAPAQQLVGLLEGVADAELYLGRDLAAAAARRPRRWRRRDAPRWQAGKEALGVEELRIAAAYYGQTVRDTLGMMAPEAAAAIAEGTRGARRGGSRRGGESVRSAAGGTRHGSGSAHAMTVVECVALGRSYGKLDAVEAVSFSMDDGEFLALLGPNGAGKSTLLHMLITLIAPSRGEARVVGADIRREPERVRAGIGVVFQDPALDDRMTARENLKIHAVLYRLPARRVAEAVDRALSWAKLEPAADRPVRTFSGGMKRRLELARALMHEPRLLVLDEPTIGLDPQGRRDLWERIAELRRGGMSVLMTTHALQEAEACCRVGIIDRGNMVAIGTPAEIGLRALGRTDASLEDDLRRADRPRPA